jgi:hypothetical protein
MHDDSELAELVVAGEWFDEMPLCWRHTVQIVESQNPRAFNHNHVNALNQYLANWNLTYVMRDHTHKSKVQGTRSNLTAWMLSHE